MNFEWNINTITIALAALDLIQIIIFIVNGVKITKDIGDMEEEIDELRERVERNERRIMRLRERLKNRRELQCSSTTISLT